MISLCFSITFQVRDQVALGHSVTAQWTQVVPLQPLNYALLVINMRAWRPYDLLIIIVIVIMIIKSSHWTTKLFQANTALTITILSTLHGLV